MDVINIHAADASPTIVVSVKIKVNGLVGITGHVKFITYPLLGVAAHHHQAFNFATIAI